MHVVTGVLALLFVFLHGSMAPHRSLGGHAYWGIVVLVLTGLIGRYFYSFLPRAANGRELELEELNNKICAELASWDRDGREFGDKVQSEITQIIQRGQWNRGFFYRIWALLTSQREMRQVIKRLKVDGRRRGLSEDQLKRLRSLTHRAFRLSLLTAHFEDLRAILATWRFFHRWLALLVVLLIGGHVVIALRYARGIWSL